MNQYSPTWRHWLFFTISAVSAHYNASGDDISNIEKDELTINTSDYDKQVLISNQNDLLSFDGEKKHIRRFQ